MDAHAVVALAPMDDDAELAIRLPAPTRYRDRRTSRPVKIPHAVVETVTASQPEPEITPSARKPVPKLATRHHRVGVVPPYSTRATERTRLLEPGVDEARKAEPGDQVLGFSKALATDEFQALSLLAVQMVSTCGGRSVG